MNKFKEVFREDSGYKAFFISLLTMGLGYGIYKGVLDNFLSEVVAMGELDRGFAEFFRELPGLFLVFILAALYTLSAENIYKLGSVIMLIGMGLHAIVSPTKVLVTLAICVYSLGEHIQLGMKNTLSLEYSKPGFGGRALGLQNGWYHIGTLAGYAVIIVAFLSVIFSAWWVVFRTTRYYSVPYPSEAAPYQCFILDCFIQQTTSSMAMAPASPPACSTPPTARAPA